MTKVRRWLTLIILSYTFPSIIALTTIINNNFNLNLSLLDLLRNRKKPHPSPPRRFGEGALQTRHFPPPYQGGVGGG